MLSRSREDSALGLASLEAVLAAFASFLAVDGASLLPALEHLDPQAVLLLQHARLQCEVDRAHFLNRTRNMFFAGSKLGGERPCAHDTHTFVGQRKAGERWLFAGLSITCWALDLGISFYRTQVRS